MALPADQEPERWIDSPLHGLIVLLGRLLLSLLLAYWAIFAAYSIGKMVICGPHGLMAWYQHIESAGGVVFLPHWSATAFLLRQLVILALTAGLWFGVVPRKTAGRKH